MLGTVFVYDHVSRPTQPESRPLKYGNGRVPVILVPQPSDDPNDPLVSKTSPLATSQTLMEAELAIMEARLGALIITMIPSIAYISADPPHSLDPLRYCLHAESSARRKYGHPIIALRSGLYADGPCYGLPSTRSWGGRLPFHSLRTSLGQASSISPGHYSHNHLQRLGRCHRDRLQKLVVGENCPRDRTGAFRSLGKIIVF